MRLVASSNPDDVVRDQALHLLTERAVLTRAVCRELLDSGGEFDGRRPDTALALLLGWVRGTFPQSVHIEPHARDGLDAMVVPEDCEDMLREIRDGAEVCEALAMLFTADNAREAEGDREKIAKSLNAYWKAHGQIVNPPQTFAFLQREPAPLADMAPLSEAVPGWEGSLIREAVERTARGVAIEQERLRGSLFLVVTRLYELDLDGSVETITIEGGHADLNGALAQAQRVCSERLVAEGLKHVEVPEWRHNRPCHRWPKVALRWNGKELPVFSDRLSDGTGWKAIEVAAAVIPTKPDTPINIDVINTIDMTYETVRWFEEVQSKGIVRVNWLEPPGEDP